MREIPPELRELFAQEASTRLARLADRLLSLEEHGADRELVGEVFRDAHSLKGSAAMMGYQAFSRVAHQMEDLLDGVRGGRRQPTAELVDALLAGVDGLRAALDAVVAGEERDEELAAIEARVAAAGRGEAAAPGSPAGAPGAAPLADPSPSPVAPPAPEPEPGPAAPEPEPAPAAPEPEPAPARGLSAPAPPRTDEAVRVPLVRLDELAALTDEALATLARAGGRGDDPDAVALNRVLADLHDKVRRARMVPLATVVDPLRRAVRDAARSTGKSVRWVVRGEDTELDRALLEGLADPLLHLVRNAVDHGIESPEQREASGKPREGTVRLEAEQVGAEVRITIADDGRGIDLARVREAAEGDPLEVIFRPGVSTAAQVTELSGRGVGLDVVRANLAAIRGRVDVTTAPGSGTAFHVVVPITLAVLPCLVVRAAGQPFALPLHAVAATYEAGADNGGAGTEGDAPVSLAAVLGLAGERAGPVVAVEHGDARVGFAADEVLGRRDVLVKGLPAALPPVDLVAGAAVEPDGSLLLLLDPAALVGRAAPGASGARPPEDEPAVAAGRELPARRVLVVDDADTMRAVEVAWLRRAGYDVRDAGHGAEALEVLRHWRADVIVLDVEMPVMDGLTMTAELRADPVLHGVAVLLVTSLGSEEDRRRGMAAGADAYLVKGTFDEAGLVGAVGRLLGEAQ